MTFTTKWKRANTYIQYETDVIEEKGREGKGLPEAGGESNSEYGQRLYDEYNRALQAIRAR